MFVWIGKEAQEEEKTEAMASGKNICRSCAGLRSKRSKEVEKWEDCSMIFHARLIGQNFTKLFINPGEVSVGFVTSQRAIFQISVFQRPL